MIDVSCILINYNSSDYTLQCVASLLENTQNDLDIEIVVVDNASVYDKYLFLKEG